MSRFAFGTEGAGGSYTAREGFRQRAGQARAAQTRGVFCIEGETVTLDGLAERLGIGRESARERLRRAQAKPEPVTWEALR